MRIKKSIINIMIQAVPEQPPEIGGILGSHTDNIVDEMVIDKPMVRFQKKCSYAPNVNFLNEKIDLWEQNGITFKGVFHTHYFGVRTLSDGDKKYIQEIMNALPACIEHLFFPIFVLPENELICYKVVRENQVIRIEEDCLVIEE